MTASLAKKALHQKANRRKAHVYQSFFKTGPGEYGEGDIFIGVTVPQTREIARLYEQLPLSEIGLILKSPIHEERLLALILLTQKFKKAPPKLQAQIFRFYLRHTRWINNWDLVDTSAPQIVGGYLSQMGADRKMLQKLSRSNLLWERRIAIVATWYFIRQNDFNDCLSITRSLLNDSHDLIHKACGWMLREVGKKNTDTLVSFLSRHASRMPRTMLRYAIERLPASQRKAFLAIPRIKSDSSQH